MNTAQQGVVDLPDDPSQVNVSQFADTPKSPTPVLPDNPSQVDPTQFTDATPQPDTPIQPQSNNLFGYLSNWVRFSSDAIGQGQAGVYRGAQGFKAMSGGISYDAAQQSASPEQIQNLTSDQQQLDRQLSPWDMHQLFGWAAEQIPQLTETVLGGAKGAAGGAAIGAAGGALGIGGQEVTVPVGASIGARLGFDAGMVTTMTKLGAGNLYMDLRQEGISNDTAKTWAFVGGAAQGVIGTFGLKGMGSLGRKAIASQLESDTGKFIVKNMVGRALKQAGWNGSTMAAMQISDLIAHHIAAQIEKNPNADVSIRDVVLQSAKAFAGGAALGVGAEAGETLVGHAAKTLQGNKKIQSAELTAAKAVQLMKEGYDTIPLTPEDIAKAKSTPTQQIVDELKQPVGSMKTDEAGQVTLKATVQKEAGKTAFDTLKSIPKSAKEATQTEQGKIPSVELKARIEQINTDIKTVDKQIASTGKEYLARQKEGKPVTALEHKMSKLFNDRHDLETERALINEKDLTPEDIAKAKAKLTVGQLTTLRAKAIANILKAYEKGVKEGARVTKANVKQVQTEVTSLIRDKSIEPKNRAKLISLIKNIQTEAQLEQRLPELKARIAAIIEDQNRRLETSRFEKLMKQARLLKGKYPVGKYTPDIQKVLDMYRDAQSGKALEDINNKIQSGKAFTDEDLLKASIVDQVSNFKNASAQDIQAINDDLEALMKGGRAKNLEDKLERQEARRQVVTDAMASIQGNKPRETEPAFDESRSAPTEPFRRFLRRFGHQLSGWDKLMSIVAQHDPNIAKGKMPDLVALMGNDRAENTHLEIRDKWTEDLKGRLEKVIGDERFIKWWGNEPIIDKNIKDMKVKPLGEAILPDGSTKSVYLSIAQARTILAEMKDPDARAGLEEGNQYTFDDSPIVLETPGAVSMQSLLENSLTPLDKEIGAIIHKFYKDFYKEVANPYWRGTRNVDLPDNEFYTPLKRRVMKGVSEDDTPFFAQQKEMGSLKPSSAVSRVKNKAPLRLQSDVSAAFSHLNDWAHFIGYEDWDKRIDSVFKNPDIQNVIASKYGDTLLANIEHQQKVITNTLPRMGDRMWQVFDRVRENLATSFVGGKLSSFPKHATAMVGWLKYENFLELSGGISYFLTHPKKVIETLQKSPMIKDRSARLDKDFLDAARDDRFAQFRLHKRMRDYLMLPVETTNKLNIYGGGWGLYQKVLKKTGSVEEALHAVETGIKETQFSSGRGVQTPLQTGHPVMKLMASFTTFPVKSMQLELESIRNFANHPNPKTFGEAAKTLAIFHFTIPALFQIASSRLGPVINPGVKPQDNWDDVVRAMALGPARELPIVGETLNYMAGALQNVVFRHKDKLWEPNTPVVSVATELAKGVQSMAKWAEDPNFDDFAKALNHLTQSVPVLPIPTPIEGMPLSPLWKVIKAGAGIDTSKKSHKSGTLFSEAELNKMAGIGSKSSGFSEAALNKMAGIK